MSTAQSVMRPLVCSLYIFYLLVGPGTSLPLETELSPSRPLGDVISDNLHASGLTITHNLHGGIVAVADPLIKFAVDTAPHLVHLYAILNGVDVPAPLAALAKDIYRKLALFGGKGIGKLGVLASQLAKGGLNVGASGLEALNNVLEAGALVGIRLGAKVADIAANATITGGNVVADGLTAVGDGFLTASAAADLISKDIAVTLGAIWARLVLGIVSAESLAAKFLDDSSIVVENGVIKFNNEQQVMVYKLLQTYLATLGNIQALMTDLVQMVEERKYKNKSTSTGYNKGSSKGEKEEIPVQ